MLNDEFQVFFTLAGVYVCMYVCIHTRTYIQKEREREREREVDRDREVLTYRGAEDHKFLTHTLLLLAQFL